MRKVILVGLSAVVALAVAAVALAQYNVPPQVVLTGKVTPTSGGNKKSPKNASASASFTVNKESRSTVKTFTFFFPKNIVLSGKGFRYCTADAIDNNGPDSCPKGSQVGSGTATALLGATQTPLNFQIKIFAASKNEVSMFLSGASAVPALRGIISAAGGKYNQKMTVEVPDQVQQPVKGVYSYLTSVSAKLGPAKSTIKVTKKVKGKKKKVKKNVFFTSLTGCPAEKAHHIGVRLDLAANPDPPVEGSITVDDTDACKR